MSAIRSWLRPAPGATRRHLDPLGCDCGGPHAEPGIHFSGKCHRDAPVKAVYFATDGLLKLTCSVCGGRIVEIAVRP